MSSGPQLDVTSSLTSLSGLREVRFRTDHYGSLKFSVDWQNMHSLELLSLDVNIATLACDRRLLGLVEAAQLKSLDMNFHNLGPAPHDQSIMKLLMALTYQLALTCPEVEVLVNNQYLKECTHIACL